MGFLEDSLIILVSQVMCPNICKICFSSTDQVVQVYETQFWHKAKQIHYIFFYILQIFFFVGGWIFFVKQLFRDYEVRHVSVQLIFSSTFTISLTMFELIIFEIVGLLESSSRYFHWRLELTLLLFMVIALIPFYIAYSSINNICFGMITFRYNTLYIFFYYIHIIFQF